jgi:hypothetical protein
MYDDIYEQMVKAGVAEMLPEPTWVNVHGDEVCEDDSFGRKVTYKLTHPSYIVFVDEVGSNTSMEGDGHVGGELFIVGKGETAKQSASKADSHFTVLGFTAATGEPIMCAIIF